MRFISKKISRLISSPFPVIFGGSMYRCSMGQTWMDGMVLSPTQFSYSGWLRKKSRKNLKMPIKGGAKTGGWKTEKRGRRETDRSGRLERSIRREGWTRA